MKNLNDINPNEYNEENIHQRYVIMNDIKLTIRGIMVSDDESIDTTDWDPDDENWICHFPFFKSRSEAEKIKKQIIKLTKTTN